MKDLEDRHAIVVLSFQEKIFFRNDPAKNCIFMTGQ